MITDAFGVTIGTASVEYADGAESDVLAGLLDAEDRTDGSDELATLMRDWPTTYHFSPARSNLLRPIEIKPGDRVLEIGCGTGALTRSLGERGASVFAIDGSLDRARAASVRCRDLPNVEVIAGSLDDVPRSDFDVVVVVGVLEYAASGDPGQLGATTFLERAAALVAPTGVLVLAIENQLGLKYLLGYDEDHRAVPWVGLENYPNPGARTWSRRRLSLMLREHGLEQQTWLYPFPDYKLPAVVIHERAYAREDAVELIDAFVREPVIDHERSRHLVSDPRRAHRTLLDAGIGMEVANSFLVVAGSADAKPRVASDAVLWHFSGPRLRRWRRTRIVRESPTGLDIATIDHDADDRHLLWLRQTSPALDSFVRGQPLDSALETALGRNDLAETDRLLDVWHRALVVDDGAGGQLQHPYAPHDGDVGLRPDHLDVNFGNFILTAGGVSFVDREWLAAGPVSASLAMTRAAWWFADSLVRRGSRTPWGSVIDVDTLCLCLLERVGVRADRNLLDRFRAAEAELHRLVSGGNPVQTEALLKEMGTQVVIGLRARPLPFTQLAATIDDLRGQLAGALDQLREALGTVDAERSASAVAAESDRTLQAEISRVRAERDELALQLEASRATVADMERSQEP